MTYLSSDEYLALCDKTDAVEHELIRARKEYAMHQMLGKGPVKGFADFIIRLEEELAEHQEQLKYEQTCRRCGGFRSPTENWKVYCDCRKQQQTRSSYSRNYNYWENPYDTYTMHLNDGWSGD